MVFIAKGDITEQRLRSTISLSVGVSPPSGSLRAGHAADSAEKYCGVHGTLKAANIDWDCKVEK
jgi:hypothetical protein